MVLQKHVKLMRISLLVEPHILIIFANQLVEPVDLLGILVVVANLEKYQDKSVQNVVGSLDFCRFVILIFFRMVPL